MIREQYVSLETAKILKEKGFDWGCYKVYNKEGVVGISTVIEDIPINYKNIDYYFLCPTMQMVLRWLRENHKLHIEVEVYYCEDGQMWLAKIQRIGDGCTTLIKTCMCNDTYETAIENALNLCLNYFL